MTSSPLSSADILRLYEQGQRLPRLERALIVLDAAGFGATREELAALPIGRREARLMRLLEALSGPTVEAVSACPRCDEKLEVPLDITSFLNLDPVGSCGEIEEELAGVHVCYRLLNSVDMAQALALGDETEGRALLLKRAILCARDAEGGVLEAVPEEAAQAVMRRIAELDPLAEVQTRLRCILCEHSWLATFDALHFLWVEIDRRARRAVSEVHRLARSYGWRESDILQMSPERRALYLEAAA